MSNRVLPCQTFDGDTFHASIIKGMSYQRDESIHLILFHEQFIQKRNSAVPSVKQLMENFLSSK